MQNVIKAVLYYIDQENDILFDFDIATFQHRCISYAWIFLLFNVMFFVFAGALSMFCAKAGAKKGRFHFNISIYAS